MDTSEAKLGRCLTSCYLFICVLNALFNRQTEHCEIYHSCISQYKTTSAVLECGYGQLMNISERSDHIQLCVVCVIHL